MNPDTNRFELLHQVDHGPEHQSGPGKGRDPAAEALAELDASRQKEALHKKLERIAKSATKLRSLVELLRPDGSPVPEHWSVFTVDDHVVVKNYTFKVAYIGESTLLLEPVGPVLVGSEP